MTHKQLICALFEAIYYCLCFYPSIRGLDIGYKLVLEELLAGIDRIVFDRKEIVFDDVLSFDRAIKQKSPIG